MSLLAFQRAFAEMAASPERWGATLRDPAHALADFDLDRREMVRLAAMARDPLMGANCTLHRANRATPLQVYLPLTCKGLGDSLRAELDEWMRAYPCRDMQFHLETARFIAHLRGRLQSGAIRDENVRIALEGEAAVLGFPAAT